MAYTKPELLNIGSASKIVLGNDSIEQGIGCVPDNGTNPRTSTLDGLW